METRGLEGLSELLPAGHPGPRLMDQVLVEPCESWPDGVGLQGDLPLHAVLSSYDSSSAAACLRSLLEHDAAVNLYVLLLCKLNRLWVLEAVLCPPAPRDRGGPRCTSRPPRISWTAWRSSWTPGRTCWHGTVRDRPLWTWPVPGRFLQHRMWHEEKRKDTEPQPWSTRLADPQDFGPRDIQTVPHRGRPQEKSTSPWTEVAVHLGVDEPLEDHIRSSQL